MRMTTIEAKNNLDKKALSVIENERFFEKNKYIFTLTLIVISIFLLVIQLMPYIYGGSLGHFHSNGMCGWPDDCSKISSFPAF